jgi:GDPmannose 4,6-dehydratase
MRFASSKSDLTISEHISCTVISGIKVGDIIVKVDPRYFRPAEVETLLGDPSNAKVKLGWIPEITVQDMCSEMVKSDLEEAKRIKLLKDHGYDVSIQLEG